MEVTMKKLATILMLAVLAASTVGVSAAEEHHVQAGLVAVGGSGITGRVNIEQLPGGGTNINVTASGLVPGGEYLSLYYENHTCALEPYSEDDIIGTYTANGAGIGNTHGQLDD